MQTCDSPFVPILRTLRTVPVRWSVRLTRGVPGGAARDCEVRALPSTAEEIAGHAGGKWSEWFSGDHEARPALSPHSCHGRRRKEHCHAPYRTISDGRRVQILRSGCRRDRLPSVKPEGVVLQTGPLQQS